MSWLRANWKIVGICVVLSLVALASAVDGYRTRKLLSAAQVNLEENAKVKERELAEAKESADKRLTESDRKLAPVLRERDALRAKLAGLEAQAPPSFVIPASDSDREARWTALGYKVRVLR